MRRGRVVAIGLGVLLLIPVVMVLYGYGGLPAWLFASAAKYKTVTTFELADSDDMRRAVVPNGCEREPHYHFTSGYGSTTKTYGEQVYFTLGDGSILFLGDQNPCRWHSGSPRAGDVVTFDPDTPSAKPATSGRTQFLHRYAWRFDNTTDPKRVVQYDNAQLYRAGAGGLKITSGRIVFDGYVGAIETVPHTLAQNFPWHRDVPWADAGQPKYDEYLPLGNFMGYRATLAQLKDVERCAGFDREADGPLPVPRDHACFRRYVENERALVERLRPDYQEISFTAGDVSPAQVMVLHRETLLKASGAPGRLEGRHFLWEPRVCVDGLCFETVMDPGGEASPRVAYYPKRNQRVTVTPSNFRGGSAFRWSDGRAN